ncbi:MAG: ABC transporter substrate-binding protein [Alphaproteobacteria bacterium]|nr:ABC transporter substrate-binding protein [Alphaproteobacteria bacterium]
MMRILFSMLFMMGLATATPLKAQDIERLDIERLDIERHDIEKHGLSLFGAVQLPPDFKHFPYVNINAPKGGTLRIAAIGSFDNLNPFTIKGNTAQGVGIIHDTLLTPSLAEPSAVYGLVAKSVAHPADFSSVTFTLRRAARFYDGSAITAADVAFSLDAIRAAHPFYRAYYGDVERSEIIDDHKIKFHFKKKGNRELPLVLGALPILSKAYWQGKDKGGERRGLNKTTLTPPLTSGAYKISHSEAGRRLVLSRVKDYWAQDLNISQGRYNFDDIIYDYFGDDTIAFEALKAGEVDFRAEFSSRLWATGYKKTAKQGGGLIREEIGLKTGVGMQAFVYNTRRGRFGDARVREALNLAFDFEWTNKNLFYGQYARTNSFFQRSELAAHGLPSPQELALLEPLRHKIPPRVFTTPYANPKNERAGDIRQHLRRARALLEQAGWVLQDNQLKRKGESDGEGEVFTIEFLLVQPAFERIIAPYIQNLAKLGITARMRVVDPSQYQNRLTNYNFDAVVASFGQSLSPGNEQRDYWSSQTASISGGRNLIGIADTAIDALVEALIFAHDRESLIAATRALDRVLLANHYAVPQWHAPHERLAFWQHIQHPTPMPDYGLGFPDIWWHKK